MIHKEPGFRFPTLTGSSPEELIRFHEALLFLRAYPRDREMLRQAEELLASFSERVAQLRKEGGNLSAFEEPEVSGISGTSFTAIYSYEVARRLAQLEAGRLAVDWDRYEVSDRLAGVWRRLIPLVEEDTLVEAHVPYREWLRAAAGGRNGSLAWLLARFEQLPLSPKDKADLWATLELPIRWDIDDSPAARTMSRYAPRRIFYHDGPLIRRREVSLEHELQSPPLDAHPLDFESGQAFLNMALATSAARFRELHGFSHGDPRNTLKAVVGRGVEVLLCGVPPEHRLPLRAYHAALIFKNGVPCGYFETLSLFDRMEVGFNLYYTFREGETAWIFARVLHLFHQLLGTTCFSIDPYQIGLGNEEAIESGAFWFYQKLGFRPVLPEVARLAGQEEYKLLRRPSYRTPARKLRRMAAGPLVFELPDAPQGDWDRFHWRRIALAVQGQAREEAAASVSAVLGIKAGHHAEFENLALVLDLIPDLADWPQPDKAALLDIVRAKMGSDESLYLRLMQGHRRLRESIRELGTPPV